MGNILAESGDAKIQAEMQQSFLNAMILGLLLVLTVLILLFARPLAPPQAPATLAAVAAASLILACGLSLTARSTWRDPVPEKPRFDFYKILPGNADAVPAPEAKPDAKTAKDQRLGRELVYYGLGSIRTLEEYRTFGSIEPATWKVRNEACSRIESRSPGFVHKYHHRNYDAHNTYDHLSKRIEMGMLKCCAKINFTF